MDEVVNFFQICHAMDQPLHEQCQHDTAAEKEFKDANQERDAADKKRAAAQKNRPSNTNSDRSNKCGLTENLCCHCKTKGDDIEWSSYSCHNFRHPNYHQPMDLLTSCSWDKPFEIMTDIAIHAIVVALVLVAACMINMIAGTTITSQLLVTTKAKVTMPNKETNLDQGHNHNQGPVLVVLEG